MLLLINSERSGSGADSGLFPTAFVGNFLPSIAELPVKKPDFSDFFLRCKEEIFYFLANTKLNICFKEIVYHFYNMKIHDW